MSIRKVVPVEEAEWRLDAAPGWVVSQEPDWDYEAPADAAIACLLLDEQHDVATHSVSMRSVRRLLTHAAVQALGQVEIDFDPAAHRLLIHELSVRRLDSEGHWVTAREARREDFLLRQREQQLEQQMLNGRLSVVALLEDVRIGDAIDLAWTLEEREPLPGLQFTTLHAFGWGFPVARASFTLHLEREEEASWRLHLGDGMEEPVRDEGPGNIRWSVENLDPLQLEPNAPGSAWPCAVLDVSAWSSWREVADFFADLWEDALDTGAEEVTAEAARLRAEFSGEALLRETIRFVQEDVRYLAVDFGHGAGMLPNGAGTVLRRRFGDCKDKSVLLTALLRELGFEACPMLVAANWTTAIQRTQPSNAVFSHAIVSLTAEGRRLFVDPTFIGQGGDLDHLTPAPYGCGLEVRAGVDGLLELPDADMATLTVIETFHLDRTQETGSVEQIIRGSGPFADDVRASLVREGVGAFGKARAESLKTHFPALVPAESPALVVDDADGNTIEVRARHGLPTWGPVGQKPPAAFTYGAHGLFYAVEWVDGPEERRLPWLLRYPMEVHHRVVVTGKCVLATASETHRCEGPGFEYSCDVEQNGTDVVFDYSWKTTQPEVSADEWPEYCRQRERALEQAGANVQTGRPASSWDWRISLAVFLVLSIGGVCAEERSARKRRDATELERPTRERKTPALRLDVPVPDLATRELDMPIFGDVPELGVQLGEPIQNRPRDAERN